MTSPSDVAVRITATSSGWWIWPVASRTSPTTRANPSESRNPSPATRSRRPRSWSRSSSRSGEEQEEGETDEREDGDELVGLGPVEHLRADDDARDDLEDDTRYPEPGREAEQQRDHEGDSKDDGQAVERDLGHDETLRLCFLGN